MTQPLRTEVKIKGLENLARRLVALGPLANQEFNRGFISMGGAFNRGFAKKKLVAGNIKPRRKAKPKAKGNHPFVPKSMRAFGFTSRLIRQKDLDGKRWYTATKNRIALAYETGATLTPKRGEYLLIRATRGRKKGEVVARVKRVDVDKRLGFIDSFGQFKSEAQVRLGKILDRIEGRAARAAGF